MDVEAIRVGLIGCGGFMTRFHLANLLASTRFRVVAACDLDPSAAERARDAAGARYATTDPQHLLGDAEVDAVVIATRHDSHAALSVHAAQAGKHILCEKPMGLNEEECREVVAAVLHAGVKYSVGYNRSMSPLVLKAQELLGAEGGRKRLIYHRIQAPFPAGHWTHDPLIGGGRFVGEGCHIFDLLCELVAAPPTTVYASGGTFLDPRAVKIPDSGIVTLSFEDGSVGTTLIASDGCPRFPKEATEIYCGGKAIYIADFTALTYRDGADAEDQVIELPAQDKGHRMELELFGEAILTDGRPPNDVPKALRAALISFRVLESMDSGQPVPISAAEYDA